MEINRLQLLLFFCLALLVGQLTAKESAQSIENRLINEFQQEFDQIAEFAKNNPQPINYQVLTTFIEEKLMRRWSSELTIRAILGREIWKQIGESEQKELIYAYSNTMRRYLYETFKKYGGQRPVATKIQLNKKLNKGWLTANLILDNFPDLSVDLKIYSYKNQWYIYDFRFQGISFIKLKEREYRQYVKENGASALADQLNGKYQEFLNILGDSQ